MGAYRHGPSGITTLGTHVRLPDGREGTVVFNGLCGVGIKWGIHYPREEDFKGTTADLWKIGVRSSVPSAVLEWEPDALLRDPDEIQEIDGTPCVCAEHRVKIIQQAEHEARST